MKKDYVKPSFRVVAMKHRARLLEGSETPSETQPNANEYNDWMG